MEHTADYFVHSSYIQIYLATLYKDQKCYFLLLNCDAFAVKVKVKHTLQQATKAQRGSRCIVYSFFNLGARWDGWPRPRFGRFTPWRHPVRTV
jgi:hypothetical protein